MRQTCTNFSNEFIRYDFIGVKSHDPVAGQRQMVERPLKLRGMVDKGMLHDSGAECRCNLSRPVG